MASEAAKVNVQAAHPSTVLGSAVPETLTLTGVFGGDDGGSHTSRTMARLDRFC
jgi:hypothetical protein